MTDTEPSKSPCKACLVTKPLKHICKVVSKRAFKPFDRIHLNTFMINPIAYNSYKYRLIFTDEALYVCWGYLFKGKNKAFVYTKQFTALVKT